MPKIAVPCHIPVSERALGKSEPGRQGRSLDLRSVPGRRQSKRRDSASTCRHMPRGAWRAGRTASRASRRCRCSMGTALERNDLPRIRVRAVRVVAKFPIDQVEMAPSLRRIVMVGARVQKRRIESRLLLVPVERPRERSSNVEHVPVLASRTVEAPSERRAGVVLDGPELLHCRTPCVGVQCGIQDARCPDTSHNSFPPSVIFCLLSFRPY